MRIEPHRGARVAELSGDDVRWLYELRTALELEAAHLALERNGGRLPPAVHEALARLEAACARRRSAVERDQRGPRRAARAIVAAAAQPADRRRARGAERRDAAVPARTRAAHRRPRSWPPTTPRSCAGSSATGRPCCASTCAPPRRRWWTHEPARSAARALQAGAGVRPAGGLPRDVGGLDHRQPRERAQAQQRRRRRARRSRPLAGAAREPTTSRTATGSTRPATT